MKSEAVNPKEAARDAAWDEYSGYDPDVPTPADMHEGFLIGFDAGVQWQRSQGDSLCRDLIGAVTEAVQMFEAVGGLRVSGGINRIMEKQVQGWQRLIDTAEERA